MLIVGCGDVGMRVVPLLSSRLRVLALSSTPSRFDTLRARGLTPLQGNLDQPETLRRLAGLATRVLHLAPPQGDGWTDARSQALFAAIRRRLAPVSLVYGSTSGVYGDCAGDWVDERRPVKPHTPRALRRADAEHRVRLLGRAAGVRASILRIPGIYAPDRVGGTPRERLRKGMPVLRREDDVFTNHIHADDLARACALALWRGRSQRTYNVNDDSVLRMGDYFDLAADLYGMARPPRISRHVAQGEMPLQMLSFMNESRRMKNQRMKAELRLKLRYPTVAQGLRG